MEKKFGVFITCTIAILLLVSSANKSYVNNADATGKTTHVEAASDAGIAAFLKDLYADYVFRPGDFSDIRSHFSEEVLGRLRDGYEYDCDREECFAVWMFRSGHQDGIDNDSKVLSVENAGNGWYEVCYSDMGFDGKCSFKAQIKDGRVFITDFKNPAYD